VCDPDGNISPRYSCSTLDDTACVENCVIVLMEYEKQAPPYSLQTTPSGGGFQCSDWAEAMVTVCQLDCAGR